ncbi:hypothetical protein BaRGS_00012387 [Batillaria attramentaria]|uniref:Uncharacterized protein n=1 Tax=Batillaria attramentaria TaxID=370345 RepID=A0ABD0LB52_9CAEN
MYSDLTNRPIRAVSCQSLCTDRQLWAFSDKDWVRRKRERVKREVNLPKSKSLLYTPPSQLTGLEWDDREKGTPQVIVPSANQFNCTISGGAVAFGGASLFSNVFCSRSAREVATTHRGMADNQVIALGRSLASNLFSLTRMAPVEVRE